MNPSRSSITGVVCGVRIEKIEEPTMREIRYLDKMVDDGQSPTVEPSKFFAYDFKGKFPRFEFSDVSASIDNDRSIFHVIDFVARCAPIQRKTVNLRSTTRSCALCRLSLSRFETTH
jgi:hypothetical protein